MATKTLTNAFDLEEYLRAVRTLKQARYFNDCFYRPTKAEYRLSRICTRTSASLHALLPQLSFKDHVNIINSMHFYVALANYDQGRDLSSITKIVDASNALQSNRNVIYCTYHYGSFRYIVYKLLERNITFALPVTHEVFTTQRAALKAIERGMFADGRSRAGKLHVLDSSNPYTLMRCVRFMRSRGSLLLYVDGNSGVGGEVVRKRTMPIVPFLHGHIYSRLGICAIAKLARAPIVPVVYDFDSLTNRALILYKPITVTSTSDFPIVLEHVFHIVGNAIVAHPERWEGFRYYWKYVLRRAGNVRVNNNVELMDEDRGRLVFNHDKFGLLRKHCDAYLLDKDSLVTCKLRSEVRSVLDRVVYRGSSASVSGSCCDAVRARSVVVSLLKHGVLVRAR